MLQKKCDYFKNGGFCQSNYDSMYLEGRDTTTTSLSAVPALRNPPITRPADVGRGYRPQRCTSLRGRMQMVFLFSTSSLCLWAARRPDTPQTAHERGRAKNPMRAKNSIDAIFCYLTAGKDRRHISPFTRPFGGTRGCSSTAERRPSEPNTRVRFPLSAPTPDGGISPIL